MAVHRRCSRVYSSVARTFYRFYPRPTSDFDGKSIFRDENHPATQLRHSDWNPFAFPWTNDEPSNVGEKKGGNELELVVYRFSGKCDRLSANLATFPARTNVSWSLEIPILLYDISIRYFLPPLIFLFQLKPFSDEIDRNSRYFYEDGARMDLFAKFNSPKLEITFTDSFRITREKERWITTLFDRNFNKLITRW